MLFIVIVAILSDVVMCIENQQRYGYWLHGTGSKYLGLYNRKIFTTSCVCCGLRLLAASVVSSISFVS